MVCWTDGVFVWILYSGMGTELDWAVEPLSVVLVECVGGFVDEGLWMGTMNQRRCSDVNEFMN